ncbi:MAG: hypothetical protein ABI724_02925 [Betaproteobacteria bacterium]
MGNEFLGDRRKALEEAYFAKHNRTLLERLRAANDTAPTLPEGSGMAANDELAQPTEFDTDGKSLVALSLAPLVAVAWAEGGMEDKQRSMVLARAAELGLSTTDRAYRLLGGWLTEPPTSALLATWKKDYVSALSLALTQEAKRELKRDILGRARTIADANGAFSGIGQTLTSAERSVMENIESAFA